MTFGEYLRSLRGDVMSQRELARRIGVGYPYISKIENGVEPPPSEEVLIKIAKELNVEADKLILAANKIPKDIKRLITENEELPNLFRIIKDNGFHSIIWEQIKNLIEGSENLYQSLFKNSRDIMLLVDPKTLRVIDANLAAYNFWSYKFEELEDKKISDISQCTEGEIFKEIENARLGEKNYYEFEYILSKNESRYLEVYTTPIMIDNRELVYAIIHDITDRRKTEDELELQKTYFQQLFENSPIAIAFLDNNLRVTNANKSFERLFQYTIEEIKEHDIRDCIYPNKACNKDCIANYVIKNGCYARKENVERKRKDGKLIYVNVVGNPVKHKDKQVGIYAIYTEHKG